MRYVESVEMHAYRVSEKSSLERREQTRYGVRAIVKFEWTENGVSQQGQGISRDISPKGMFIYSSVSPPAKADLRVDVSFREEASVSTNLQMRAMGLVIRVESPVALGAGQGFAILNRSYHLYNGLNVIQD